MGDPYELLLPEDLRRLMSSSRTTPLSTATTQQHQHTLSAGYGVAVAVAPPNSYDPIMVGDTFFPRVLANFPHHDYYYSSSSVNPTTATANTNTSSTSTSSTTVAAAAVASSDHAAFCSIDNNPSEKGWLGFDPANNRWPRQETLSLLEIRSRLDSKFRENNQKAPLWNEISRIMAEEFGYQRSGKKCKEKFENLYKYYKKTKEGKASRQDGKHYRFFRQLEAICGEPTTHHGSTSDHKTHHYDAGNTGSTIQNPNQHKGIGNSNNLKCSESLSFSTSSDQFETSSSENNDIEDLSAIAYMMKQSKEKQKGLKLDQRKNHGRVRKSWRAKVEEIVGSHMRKIIETQDAWMERMLSVVEQREQEMASKEEERKRKESMRFDQEVHELWAKERAWVEARDAALIKVVRKHIENNELEALMPLDEAKNKLRQANEYPCEGFDHTSSSRWTEMEISNLIQLRTGFEQQLRGNGYLESGIWDEIAAKLACLGFDRSASECKQIWDEISISLRVTVECGGAKTRPWCLGLKLTGDDDL